MIDDGYWRGVLGVDWREKIYYVFYEGHASIRNRQMNVSIRNCLSGSDVLKTMGFD